jgi:hypothetical protein
VLSSLAELRGSANFSLEAEVDHVVGRAVAAMGPARLLAAIPLNITGMSYQLYIYRHCTFRNSFINAISSVVVPNLK